jgi:hypothetical protein
VAGGGWRKSQWRSFLNAGSADGAIGSRGLDSPPQKQARSLLVRREEHLGPHFAAPAADPGVPVCPIFTSILLAAPLPLPDCRAAKPRLREYKWKRAVVPVHIVYGDLSALRHSAVMYCNPCCPSATPCVGNPILDRGRTLVSMWPGLPTI